MQSNKAGILTFLYWQFQTELDTGDYSAPIVNMAIAQDCWRNSYLWN
jgi:hypothetical protein